MDDQGEDIPAVHDEVRMILLGLADALIPETCGMPAPSQIGVHREGLDRVLEARPDLAGALMRALAPVGGRPGGRLPTLQDLDRAGFLAVATVVAGAYYTDPVVMKLIGYEGQQPVLPDPQEAAFHLRDGLLDAVRGRGPIYRPTPARGESGEGTVA